MHIVFFTSNPGEPTPSQGFWVWGERLLPAFALPMGRRWPTAVRYGIAVGLVALTHLAGPELRIVPESALVPLLLCAIMGAAWMGGAGPGLLAAALSTVGYEYAVYAGEATPADETFQIVRGLVFIIEAVLVGSLSDARWRMRDEIKRADDTLLGILDAIPALAARYRPDGIPDFVNKAWRDYTGWFSYPGIHWGAAIHPDDLEKVSNRWQRHLASGEPLAIEQRLLRADGTYRWFLVLRGPMRDNSGTIINWYGIAHDIEDRKRAEEKIHIAERELRETVNTIPSLVWRAGLDEKVEFYNARWLEYAGIDERQAKDWDWTTAVHPDDRSHLADAWIGMKSSATTGEAELRLRRHDNIYRWFLFRVDPYRDETGKTTSWYGVFNDIDDRKGAEVALRESEQRFRDFTEATSDWYWETDADHRYTELPGDRAPRLGKRRWDLATDLDEEPQKWRDHMALLDAHKPFRGFVFRATRLDGSTIYVSTGGIPRFDDSGRFLGYRGCGSDVTAAVRAEHAEAALRQARTELAHVTRVTALGEMAASIAHEVNQPLAGIVTNGSACLRWLNRDPLEIDEVRESVESIINDGKRASEIVSRVRALAKKADPQMVAVDINEIVNETLILLQREISGRRVELEFDLVEKLPEVMGDRVQLQQVVMNLITNGIEAMEHVNDRPRTLRIGSALSQEGKVVATFRDSGPGISKEHAERLFEAFFTTKSHGLGMGLSICRSIIEAHAGRLILAANADDGATFQIILPIASRSASRIE